MKKIKNIIIVVLLITNIITGILLVKYKNESVNIPEKFRNINQNDKRMGPPNRDKNSDTNRQNTTNNTEKNTDTE